MYNTPDFDKQMNMTQGEKAIERLRNRASFMAEDYHQDLDIVEKELKKGIAARKFLAAITRELTEEDFEDFTVDDLNAIMKEHGISETFTQEEYDLIKEEILCH